MNEMTIRFNGQDYIAIYNSQTGYYELELTAPQTGGIYDADITFVDLFDDTFQDSIPIQVLAKEEVKIETNKVFMWLFDHTDFSVKDIVELTDYEINIDEETNANTIINVIKKTTAKARDIIVIKKNNDIVYWGTVDSIQNDDGKLLYEFVSKYVTNIFDQKIELRENKKINNNSFYEGVFVIRNEGDEQYCIDADISNTNVLVWKYHNAYNQKFFFKEKRAGIYTIKVLNSDNYVTIDDTNNIIMQPANNLSNQEWIIIKKDQRVYSIKSNKNGLCIDINGTVESGANVQGWTENGTNAQRFFLEAQDEEIINKIGIEDFIAFTIRKEFIYNEDAFINKNYLAIEVKTHTPKQTSVTNVEDGIYNLHTWMTNCTQNYDIVYGFSIVDKKLVITIENKTLTKELIDVKAQAISNYSEVFETDVVSKVIVLYDKVNGADSKGQYVLYLRTDRTTTTDMNDENRAEGKVETVYTENYEDANQKALDVMKANSYNHNITFNLYDKYIKVGTPIAIKTKESIILDTYISAVKITQKKFYEYTCGNIRVKFIDKLLKERRN